MSGFFAPVETPFQTWAEFEAARERYVTGAEPRDPRGRQPRRRNDLVTKRVDAHDGTPCVVAWNQFTRGLEGQPSETFGKRKIPWGSFQVYAPCTDKGENTVARVATYLEEKSFFTRHGDHLGCRDRLDVYGLVLPEELSREELVSRCIEHQRAELAVRGMGNGEEELFIQPWSCYYHTLGHSYRHGLVILETVPGANEDFDNLVFLFVKFDRISGGVSEAAVYEVVGLDSAAKEMYKVRGGNGSINNIMQEIYNDFTGDMGDGDFQYRGVPRSRYGPNGPPGFIPDPPNQ